VNLIDLKIARLKGSYIIHFRDDRHDFEDEYHPNHTCNYQIGAHQLELNRVTC